jgi:uncharacterized Zn finger protein
MVIVSQPCPDCGKSTMERYETIPEDKICQVKCKSCGHVTRVDIVGPRDYISSVAIPPTREGMR